MKLGKRLVSMVLAVALILSFCPAVLAAEGQFTDLPSDYWAYGYIQDVVEKGLMKGTSDTTFAPEHTMIRGMFVTVLYRMSGQTLEEGKTCPFPDVAANRYYTEAVTWAAEAGIVEGFENGTFHPERDVTREQAATFLARYAKHMHITLPQENPASSYTDAEKISDYAREAIELCSRAGILNGYPQGEFKPQKTITRAESAKLYSVFLAVTEDSPEPTTPSESTEPTETTEPSESTEPTQTTEPSESTEPARLVKITFVGEHAYVKYQGQKVTQIEVSTAEPYVEFGIYADQENGFEVGSATASSGKLNRGGDIFILSDFEEDVTIHYQTQYMTMRVDFELLYSESLETPQYVTWGQCAVEPKATWTGYHIEGWYYDRAYTMRYDFSAPVKENLTLYGKWAVNVYTVSFYDRGQLYTTQQVNNGGSVALPDGPTNEDENYVFNGWFLDEACTQPFDGRRIYGDLSLYAGWVEKHWTYVYLDGTKGDDANSGATANDAVATFARAKELLAKAEYPYIMICGTVTVSDEQVWTLADVEGARIYRDVTNTKSFLVKVSGSLTLHDIEIDGGRTFWASEGEEFAGYELFTVAGTLTLNDGTVLQNSRTSSLTSNSAVVYMNGNNAKMVINDGAKITGNYGGSGSAIGGSGNGWSVVMNGGEISNNVCQCTSTGTGYEGGTIYLKGGSSKYASFEMNGGLITNNVGPVAGTGGVSVNQYANAVFNGGSIVNNDGGTKGGAISTTGSSATKLSSVTINGGTFKNNTCKSGNTIVVNGSSNLILNTPTRVPDMDGAIYLTNVSTRQPIQLNGALEAELNLEFQTYLGQFQRLIFRGTDDYRLTEADIGKAKLTPAIPERLKLTLDAENNTIFMGSAQNIATEIFLSGEGKDTNDGLTKETAVATFAKAKELLMKNQSDTGENVITIVAGMTSSKPQVVMVTQDQTWSLAGIPNAYVQCEKSSKGYMAYVKGCTLTLQDIVIDGSCFFNTVNTYAPIRVEFNDSEDNPNLSVLEMRSGTVIQNTPEEGVYTYGGNVNMYDGAKITGAQKDCAIYVTGGVVTAGDRSATLNIYGGEIVDNQSRCIQVSGDSRVNIYGGLFSNNVMTANGGGGVVYASSATTPVLIAGGTFTNNALKGTSTTSVGTVFYTSNATKPVVTGGTFSGNTCAYDPDQNGFSCAATGAGKAMSPVIKPGAGGLDLSNVPFVWAFAEDAACLQIAGALTSTLSVKYPEAPKSGQVVAVGAEGYTLTQADLAKLNCLNAGVTLKLDTAKNQIQIN